MLNDELIKKDYEKRQMEIEIKNLIDSFNEKSKIIE